MRQLWSLLSGLAVTGGAPGPSPLTPSSTMDRSAGAGAELLDDAVPNPVGAEPPWVQPR